ncbi:MAG TPA: flagellar basal body P-ring formation chaperone FlgA [Syntrophorhabdales bacterium]|nr:flagellar basal body P-ring formation chaperone FlgA [Syntrophorhabdales bacterium]
MKILLIAVSLVLFFLSNGACFGQQTAVIEKRLTDLLKETYGAKDMQVKLDSIPPLLKQNIKVRSVNVYTMPEVGGKGLAVMEFEGEDGKLRSSYLPFRVYEKNKLFYTKRALPKGSPLSADDLGSKEAYASESELIYPKDLRDVVGKVLKKDVAPGTVLTTLLIESPEVIHRGEMVTIVGENTQLLVRTKGKAEEPGRMGERIRVKNLSSDREVVGRVAGNGTVNVDF